MTSADAVIAVTPVFSASYSGLFKSFFDVLDPQSLVGKPVLMAATGGSARHSLVLDYALRPLFSYLKATMVSTGVFAATADFGSDEAGRSLADRVHRAAAELVGVAGAGRVRSSSGATRPTSARARRKPGRPGRRARSVRRPSCRSTSCWAGADRPQSDIAGAAELGLATARASPVSRR